MAAHLIQAEFEARRQNISFEEQLAKTGQRTPANRVGDPEIHAWIRHREAPASLSLQQALLTHFCGGMSIAAAMMPHPGIGPVISLAFVLTIGSIERFRRSRQVSSYLGLDPRLNCSADRMRMGSISKQGSSTTRWLLVEAGQTAARKDAELRRLYQRLKFRRGSQIAKVAVARRLAVRLYWMLRRQVDYAGLMAQLVRLRGSSGNAVMEAVSPSRG